MKWSRDPLYARDLQVFVNWAMGYKQHRPEDWRIGDESYDHRERSFKVQLCSEFAKVFGAFPPYSVERLREGALKLLNLQNIGVRSDFSFIHGTEISRFSEWLSHEDDEKLWKAFSVLYSTADDKQRFSHFVGTVVECLEQRESPSRVSPPMLTFWLAYHDPCKEVFFKPRSTRRFYQRYDKAPPCDRVVVERYLKFRQDAADILCDLKSVGLRDADMIDVQSLVWVIGQGYAWD